MVHYAVNHRHRQLLYYFYPDRGTKAGFLFKIIFISHLSGLYSELQTNHSSLFKNVPPPPRTTTSPQPLLNLCITQFALNLEYSFLKGGWKTR